MPNWCSNHIVMEGPTDKVEAVWSKATDSSNDGLLEAMVPLGHWEYDRAINTWGTKWDIDLTDANLELERVNDTTSAIVGYFESAWGPPTDACFTYMDNNPDVEIKLSYYEPGNDFCGTLETGEITCTGQPRSFWERDEDGIHLDETFYITEVLDEYQEDIESECLDDHELVNPEQVPHA